MLSVCAEKANGVGDIHRFETGAAIECAPVHMQCSVRYCHRREALAEIESAFVNELQLSRKPDFFESCAGIKSILSDLCYRVGYVYRDNIAFF